MSIHKSETLRTEVFQEQPKNDSVFAKRVADILSQYSPDAEKKASPEASAERLTAILETLTDNEREAVLASKIPALLEANARIAANEGTSGEIARAHAESIVSSGIMTYRGEADAIEAANSASFAAIFSDAGVEPLAA